MNIFLLLPPITQLEAFKSNLSKAEPGYEQQEATTALEREIRIKYTKTHNETANNYENEMIIKT